MTGAGGLIAFNHLTLRYVYQYGKTSTLSLCHIFFRNWNVPTHVLIQQNLGDPILTQTPIHVARIWPNSIFFD